ncbi:uncharacterized protein LOC108906321 isoform X4 [Anoplophora glabripennis]|uniref:uncharacterized protein LOC108906321 isoform X4 n=1 Tax=Anoplophora glabripennis TaxID=217634 RepID=UPI000873A54B|nr:uncharacterized protein LOC108906321 isoform X4 [Anoplophora glabripennis]
MKTCIAFICVATLVVSIRGLKASAHLECQADPKTRVNEISIKRFNDGEDIDKSAIGVYALCLSTKLNYINEEGKINIPIVKKFFSYLFLNETVVNQAIERCSNAQKDDPQDTAMALAKCFRESYNDFHKGNNLNH